MQYSTILLTALTALSTGVSGLAIPSLFTRERCIEELPQYQQVKANQSTALGWQLAGSASDRDKLDSTCAALNNGDYDRLAQEGLIIDDIKKPVCNSDSSSPNATLALPSLVAANSKTFTTLLLNAFPATNTSALSYLCTNLRYIQLDGFLLNSNTIIASVCALGDATLNPQPFSAAAQVNGSAVAEFKAASAKLYAYTLASAASSPAALDTLCTSAPAHHDAWDKLLLNPTAVQETLCSVKEPLSVPDGKAKISEWTSRLFAVVVGNISNAKGYREFLCDGGLSCEGMEDVGMDGELVRGLVCAEREG